MRPNIKANAFSNLCLSGSGKRLPNCFGFTISYGLMMESPVGVWKLEPWHMHMVV